MNSQKISGEDKAEKKSKKSKAIEGEPGTTVPEGDVCQKAPEWAEHSRLHDEDEPCDDGRAGYRGDKTESKDQD
jgi:hypothetical protein